jgi:TorA maturation chaperone TorD
LPEKFRADDHFGLEMNFCQVYRGQIQILPRTTEEAAFFESDSRFSSEQLLKWTEDFTDNILYNARTLYFKLSALYQRVCSWMGLPPPRTFQPVASKT